MRCAFLTFSLLLLASRIAAQAVGDSVRVRRQAGNDWIAGRILRSDSSAFTMRRSRPVPGIAYGGRLAARVTQRIHVRRDRMNVEQRQLRAAMRRHRHCSLRLRHTVPHNLHEGHVAAVPVEPLRGRQILRQTRDPVALGAMAGRARAVREQSVVDAVAARDHRGRDARRGGRSGLLRRERGRRRGQRAQGQENAPHADYCRDATVCK